MTITEKIQSHPVTIKLQRKKAVGAGNFADVPRINLQNANLHAITEAECVDIVRDELLAERSGTIITINLDHLRRYNNDPYFRELVHKASLHVADGMPLIWASRLQGTPLPERVTGSNLIWSLSEMAAKNHLSVFFLGGEPGTALEASAILQRSYPGLEIAGTFCPPLGFENRPGSIDEMAQIIVKAEPDIIFVALGSPKQEQLIERLRGKIPAVWWLGVGISFSFVSGDVIRAPHWMQNLGLEWLHRLIQEPGRLAKRYFRHGFPFFAKLMITSLMARFR